jgi:hypothetical protein
VSSSSSSHFAVCAYCGSTLETLATDGTYMPRKDSGLQTTGHSDWLRALLVSLGAWRPQGVRISISDSDLPPRLTGCQG